MIELVVEEYCSECPEFEPDVDRDETAATITDFSEPKGFRIIRSCNTIIRCTHAARCARIQQYLFLKGREQNDQT